MAGGASALRLAHSHVAGHAPWSARKIEPFVRKHKIDMSEFEPGPFKSYAAFFDRGCLPGKRRFPVNPDNMGAFGEAPVFWLGHARPGQPTGV